MKKKIVALCLVVCLATVAVCSATFAYLTSTDKATNVFTTGDVVIDLQETFPDDHLIPGKKLVKEVDVTNTGSEDAYVRVHIAIPAILDSGSEDQPQFAAYNNTLHWNFALANTADGLWNWGISADASGYPGNGGEWNFYTTEIDGVKYNVYVATYETVLEKGKTADNAIHQVYLDVDVTNDGLDEITKELGQIKILVAAEGGQAEGFDDAFDALNTQFGVPSADNNPFN